MSLWMLGISQVKISNSVNSIMIFKEKLNPKNKKELFVNFFFINCGKLRFQLRFFGFSSKKIDALWRQASICKKSNALNVQTYFSTLHLRVRNNWNNYRQFHCLTFIVAPNEWKTNYLSQKLLYAIQKLLCSKNPAWRLHLVDSTTVHQLFS